jgi:hypothetical protein
MMHIQKIVLHLENEHRQEVIDWFSFQLPGGQGESWWIKSNYDTHGCLMLHYKIARCLHLGLNMKQRTK